MKSRINIIISMLIFGSIGIFVRNIKLSSLEIAFLRAVIGSLFLILASFIMRQKLYVKSIKNNILLLIVSGAAIGLNWILLFQAYKYTSISNATLSYYFAPVFVMVAAPLILKERLTVKKVLCVVMAMVGLIMIVNVKGNDSSGSYNHLLGVAYGLSAAALYASVVLMNKFIRELSSFETTLIQLFIAGLVLIPNILLKGGLDFSGVSGKTWVLIVIVGIMHTGIAYLLYFTSFKQLPSQSIAILSYIDPISAVIMAAIFLGESMNVLQMLGGVLILGSTFISERRK